MRIEEVKKLENDGVQNVNLKTPFYEARSRRVCRA